MEDEPTLMDIFKVLARRWKLIVAITLVPTIVVAGVLLVAVTPTFTSTAVVPVSDTKPTVTVENPDQLVNTLGNMRTLAVTLMAALLLGVLLAFLIDYVQTACTPRAAARPPQES